MGTVLRIDQPTWSTMRMVQDAVKWSEERNGDGSRRGSIQAHKAVLKTFIEGIQGEAA